MESIPHTDLLDHETLRNKVADIRSYLLNELVSEETRKSLPNVEANDLKHICSFLEIGQFEEAYEYAYGFIRANDLSDTLFLCLAYTNHVLGYPEAAAKYAEQASKLHELVGKKSHSELLSSFARLLRDQSQKFLSSQIVVNDRFVHFYPSQEQLEDNNAVDIYIMRGFEPARPFLTREDTIITIGSCFTGNVSTFLRQNGFKVPILNPEYQGNLPTGSFSDEVFNTFLLRNLVEQAFSKSECSANRLDVVNQHNKKSSIPIVDLKSKFAEGSVFVLTLGIAEVWFNKQTGEVYKTAKSVDDYDPDIHDFRISSVEENFENISRVYQIIREHNKYSKIIFTLSPVPLKATFRAMSATVANSVSKSILRVALDELLSKFSSDDSLHYFPSYELITDCLPKPFGEDRRYIKKETINFVMELFARHYIIFDKKT